MPEGLVVSSLQRLADWCLKYERDEDRRGGLPPIPSSGSMAMLSGDAHVRHAAFYASCQALLYVLCYHMEPLLRQRPSSRANAAAGGQQQQALQQGKGGAEQPPSGGTPGSADGTAGGSGSLRHPHHGHHHEQQREACVAAVRELFEAMPRLLAHRLDPLGSCARSVVAEFGRQARQLGFQELYKLIREWERQQAAGTKRQVCCGQGWAGLGALGGCQLGMCAGQPRLCSKRLAATIRALTGWFSTQHIIHP